MVDGSAKCPLKLSEIRRAVVGAAAALRRQRDDVVDVRVARELPARADSLHDLPGRRRGAVHRSKHGDVVPRSHAAVGATEAQEGPPLGLRDELDRRVVGADRVVQPKLALADPEVVGMDVLAARDLARGEADDLAVPPHRLPGLDRAQSDLVPCRHSLLHADGTARSGQQHRPRREHLLRDRHVVAVVEEHCDAPELDRLRRRRAQPHPLRAHLRRTVHGPRSTKRAAS